MLEIIYRRLKECEEELYEGKKQDKMLEKQIGGLKKLSQMTKPKEAMRIFHNDGKVIQEAKSKDPCQDLELEICRK